MEEKLFFVFVSSLFDIIEIFVKRWLEKRDERKKKEDQKPPRCTNIG